MKNIMKNNNILGALTAVLFVTVLSFGALGFAPAVHADDDFGGGYTDSCCGGSYSDGIDYSSTPSYDYGQGSYSDSIDYSYSPSYDYGQGSYSDGIDYSSAPSYSTPSYGSTGYGSTGGGYSTGGYSTGGYSTGGYSTGGGYQVGGGYGYTTPVIHTPAPVVTTPSNTTVTTTTTTDSHNTSNTCTNNSCNSDDHSVVNISNPAPVINNNNVVANYAQPVTTSYPTQQYCQSGYSGVYPNCYRQQIYPAPVAQPVVYGNTPYVSLSQVPYTGLELGFWGSIAYWGAFVLFALFAAYLIAIKRVQNTVANYLKSVLFGTDEVEVITTETVTAPAAPAPAPETTNGDVIDSFIMSQINRARA